MTSSLGFPEIANNSLTDASYSALKGAAAYGTGYACGTYTGAGCAYGTATGTGYGFTGSSFFTSSGFASAGFGFATFFVCYIATM